MSGQVSERWIANIDNDDEDAPDGRIELVTLFVGEHAVDEFDDEFEEDGR